MGIAAKKQQIYDFCEFENKLLGMKAKDKN
jgi:hypothetical protein